MTAKSRRRRLLLWSALPVLLVLCVAAKLLSVGILADRTAAGFAAGNADAVEAAARGLGVANIVEPYKAPFAAGDAAVLAEDYATARTRFEEALALVPGGTAAGSPGPGSPGSGSPGPGNPGDACIIRVNLVLAIERLGDKRLEAGDPASAVLFFKEALETAGQAPEGCQAPGSETAGRLAAAGERLENKLGTAQQAAGGAPEPGKEPAPDPSADPRQSQLDQLQDSARQAERERNSGREREEYLDGSDGTAPERPW